MEGASAVLRAFPFGVPNSRPRHAQRRRFVAAPCEDDTLDRLPLGGHSLIALERATIRQTLLTARGNKVHAAKALGIAPSTLYEKLKKYGL